MNSDVTTTDVVLRIVLAAIGGGLIGLDRGEHGRTAGLRTTILVCVAAAVSMIQVNLWLTLSGRNPNSFVMLDLMRLPLGILSGMGFIGAGAIMKQGNTVLGVTTAATLWFVTVMGLCLGAGQIMLGAVMLCIGLVVLVGLRLFEDRMRQDRRAVLNISLSPDGPTHHQIRDTLLAESFKILSLGISRTATGERSLTCTVLWRARRTETEIPKVIDILAQQSGVSQIQWMP